MEYLHYTHTFIHPFSPAYKYFELKQTTSTFWRSRDANKNYTIHKERQHTYDVTMRRFHESTVAVEKEQVLLTHISVCDRGRACVRLRVCVRPRARA